MHWKTLFIFISCVSNGEEVMTINRYLLQICDIIFKEYKSQQRET